MLKRRHTNEYGKNICSMLLKESTFCPLIITIMILKILLTLSLYTYYFIINHVSCTTHTFLSIRSNYAGYCYHLQNLLYIYNDKTCIQKYIRSYFCDTWISYVSYHAKAANLPGNRLCYLRLIALKSSQAKNANLIDLPFVLIAKIMMDMSQNFAHAMTAQLSWHVQNCGLNGSLEIKTNPNDIESWVHKSWVRRPHVFPLTFMTVWKIPDSRQQNTSLQPNIHTRTSRACINSLSPE